MVPLEDHDDEFWEELYTCLYVFTDKWLQSRQWFRKTSDKTYLKGKQPHDYVTDAIEKYYNCPEKFNPEKGTLLGYLKYNIIRSLVSNDVTSPENLKSKDIQAHKQNEDNSEDSDMVYAELIIPYAENFFDDEIDYNTIVAYVEQEISGRNVEEAIFIGHIDGLKRGEIIKEFGLTEKEYNNGVRRLDTVLNKTINNFRLND